MQMVGDLLDGQDLRLMSVLMCGALATVPSQKHIAFITTTLYAAKDWMLRHPKFCEWLLQAGAPSLEQQHQPVSRCAAAISPRYASQCPGLPADAWCPCGSGNGDHPGHL